VRQAMFDVMRFWLDRGVDGFRVDVMWLMIKDEQFRDNPMNPLWRPGDPPIGRQEMIYNADQPETHAIVRQIRAICDAYGERVLIGEIYLPLPRLVTYYGAQGDEAHLPFNFELIKLPWRAEVIRQAVEQYEAALPPRAWPNWVLGNHDQPRLATRTGPHGARPAQMLLLTLRGTPTCYYGDEIGMHDVAIPHEQAFDPMEFLSPGTGRDPERTPMQWDASPNAGFTRGEPWLPVADDYQTYNVEVEQQDMGSLLSLVHRLLLLRRATPTLQVGSYVEVDTLNDQAFAYLREYEGHQVLVALNFSPACQDVDLTEVGTHGNIVISTFLDREGPVELTRLTLRGNEGVVIETN
jgi:alpha-glucosidase